MTVQQRLQVKNRIMGVLLRDARLAAGRSTEEAADVLGIDEEEYKSYEVGFKAPTLPQLEILAYFLDVPIEHFWEGETLTSTRDAAADALKQRVPDVLMLRQRIIGVTVRQMREKEGLTVEEVAERTGHTPAQLKAIEAGAATLPVNELEMVANVLRVSIRDLVEGSGEVGTWIQAQKDFEKFADLPDDVRDFVLQPINRSYIDLAKRMADMEVDKLRTIAESILEITY